MEEVSTITGKWEEDEEKEKETEKWEEKVMDISDQEYERLQKELSKKDVRKRILKESGWEKIPPLGHCVLFDEYVLECRRAIGIEDADAYLQNISDILSHPRFLKHPVSFWGIKNIENLYADRFKGKIWASFHPSLEKMLGVYVVYFPSKEIKDKYVDLSDLEISKLIHTHPCFTCAENELFTMSSDLLRKLLNV